MQAFRIHSLTQSRSRVARVALFGGRAALVSSRATLLAGWLCGLFVALPSGSSASPTIDLMGTWYVLVHYRDEASNNPEQDRWEDKVWVFGNKGSRLAWTEYSIVVFADPRGRFERTMSGMQSRVLAAWEPSERQRNEIDAGLSVGTRGSKTKTLRGSPSKGYKSVGSLRTQSVSVIGYHETWSIEGLPDEPVFTRDDLMGSGRTAKMEGRTQYRGSEVLDGGDEIHGTFERDGTRHGVFRMMRAGDLVEGGRKKKSQERKRPYLSVFASRQDKRDIGALLARREVLSESELSDLRDLLSQSIGQTLKAFGLEGLELAQRTESLSFQVGELLIEQGKTVDEVEEMTKEGAIQP